MAAIPDPREDRAELFVGTSDEVSIERPSNPEHASKITPEQIRDFFAGKVDKIESAKALPSSEPAA